MPNPAPPDQAWRWTIPLLFLIEGVALAVFSLQAKHLRLSVFATGIGVIAAGALAGGLVGFLFGIPRTVGGATTAADGTTIYQGNTNLEQVSDWLTKILVGVGLVQLGRALPALSSLADSLAAPMGGGPSSAAFGLTLALTSAGLGFLYLYLWSRLRFAAELRGADLVNQQIGLYEEQKASILVVVNRQLAQGGTPPSQNELDEALLKADDASRLLVFNQAERVRHDNWELNKPAMERTIPVFRALIAADTENHHHRNHGSLGWALKDQQVSDYRAAVAELTQAIAIRDSAHTDGWRVYEANRALCNIHLLTPVGGGAPSDEAVELINTDLRTAIADPFAADMIRLNPELQQWLVAHPL